MERTLITAKIRIPHPKLFVFVALDSEAMDTRAVNDHLFHGGSWLRKQIRELAKQTGLECEIMVCWSSDSMLYPDRGAPTKLADKTGVPIHRIHVKQGYTMKPWPRWQRKSTRTWW